LSFWLGFISLSKITFSFINFFAEKYDFILPYGIEYSSIIFHSSVVDHLSWLHCLVIVNGATINMGVQVSPFYVIYNFSNICSSVTAGSYSSSSFSWLKKLYADFHWGYTNLHSHQQCIGFLPFSPSPPPSPASSPVCTVIFLDDGHFDWAEMESQWLFLLH
jgi:hypothetical protein